MKVLFPQFPLMRKLPEPVFEQEYEAAKNLGFECLLFAEEAMAHEGLEAALRHIPPAHGETLLYRGWIFSEEVYRPFYEALWARGYHLVNTPTQYVEVTYFPNYYPKIRDSSPQAVWTEVPDAYQAWSQSRRLGEGPFVLKDHIKSAKHLWHEACFVPKASGREHFELVAENLRREQGNSFHRGFVVKQYVPLRSRGSSPRDYPFCEEYRLFFWEKKLLIGSSYHDLASDQVDLAPFAALAGRFEASFFTMDVAQTETGTWIIVDMGSGECSSLPPRVSATIFYGKLREFLNSAKSAEGSSDNS